MKYTYQGDSKQTEVFGLVFPKGEPVEVTDAYALSKLANHPLFTVEIEVPNEPAKTSATGNVEVGSVGSGNSRRGRPAKRN